MSAVDTYIIFSLASSLYGVRSHDVLHVDMLEHVTPVPNAHPALDGVVFSRGKVIPALNLRARFGLEREPFREPEFRELRELQGRGRQPGDPLFEIGDAQLRRRTGRRWRGVMKKVWAGKMPHRDRGGGDDDERKDEQREWASHGGIDSPESWIA